MLSGGYFEIAAPKTFENIQKMYVIEFNSNKKNQKLQNFLLLPTVGLKTPPQILFWRCSKSKNVFLKF